MNVLFSAPNVTTTPPVDSDASTVPVVTAPTAMPAKSSAVVIVSFEEPSIFKVFRVEHLKHYQLLMRQFFVQELHQMMLD